MMMSMSTRVMALAPSTTSTRTTTTTTPSVVTAGLKDLDKDLAKVNPSQMSDALQGDDRDARREAVIGVGGSLVTLKNTGCGLPPGPGGQFGAEEGISYLYVTGLIAYSAVKKVKTGSGLPEGPGGVLGLAEGLAYLCAIGGLAVLGAQVADYGFVPNAVPVEGGACFSP